MNLSLDEVDHILKALNTMSSYDVARAREMIEPGTTHHEQLVQKLKDYRLTFNVNTLFILAFILLLTIAMEMTWGVKRTK